MIRTISLLALSAGLASPAYAWKHTSFIWTADQLPITYHVADDPRDPDGECTKGVAAGDCRASVLFSVDGWEAVPCTDLDLEVANDPIANNRTPNNGITEVIFDDPRGDIDDPAALAVTFSTSTGAVYELNGQLYFQLDDADIVFKVNGSFVTDAEIARGNCRNRTSIDNTMLHEMGHSLGLGHSCDDGEICTDPNLIDATMYWVSKGACDTTASSLNVDDYAGLQSLYGPFATFACSNEDEDGYVRAVVPFTLRCGVDSDRIADITETTWGFGDGTTDEGITVEHTYETPGNYSIGVSVTGVSAECTDDETGENTPWTYEYNKVGYVTACGLVQGEFTADPVGDLSYQMLNSSDVSVYGCISEISWAVYQGDKAEGEPLFETSAWEPVFDFPEKGMYTIIMNLGGPAGTTGAQLVLEVTDTGRNGTGGCDHSGGSLVWTMALSSLFLVGRRRR